VENNAVVDDPLAHSVGLVLAGYLMVLPIWGICALWNRLVPSRTINPWILPSLAWLFIGFCCLVVYLQGQSQIDDPMMITAFLPAALGCPIAAWRWRQRDRTEETLGMHRD